MDISSERLSSEQLLDWLRSQLGAALSYATEPVRLTGGFDTVTMAFRLADAPEGLGGELILRVLPPAAPIVRLRREVATHEDRKSVGRERVLRLV